MRVTLQMRSSLLPERYQRRLQKELQRTYPELPAPEYKDNAFMLNATVRNGVESGVDTGVDNLSPNEIRCFVL